MGIGFGIAMTCFGSTAPMINEILTSILKTKFAPAFYVIFTTIIPQRIETLNEMTKFHKLANMKTTS